MKVFKFPLKHFVLFSALLTCLIGCESAPIKDLKLLRTSTPLNPSIALPLDLPVVYRVDKSKPEENGVNFYQKLEEASQLVLEGIFTSAKPLSINEPLAYLFSLSALSTWDNSWGFWRSKVDMQVFNAEGKLVFSHQINKRGKMSGADNVNAIHNAIAAAIKEGTYLFLNRQADLAAQVAAVRNVKADVAYLKKVFEDTSPTGSGTGFFVNRRGTLVTASHVVNDCVWVDVRSGGNTWSGAVTHTSDLLDLAVIETDLKADTRASLGGVVKPKLGAQVVVAGFPLSDVLSEYPSLTMGNVSSVGGLVGSKANFQFSAPVQPGNSGGPIVDYRGNLVGVVSSSFNQAMMLKKTGTTAQNLNFGVSKPLLRKFLDKHGVRYRTLASPAQNFEAVSKEAVQYTNQVLCYR